MLQKSIDDPLLRKLISTMGGCDMQAGPWIAGGAARRLWFDEPWTHGDVDFWFADPQQYARAKDMLDAFVKGSALYDHIHKPWIIANGAESRPIHESDRAVTYRVLLSSVTSGEIATAQIIRTRWLKDVQDIFGYFDFTACKFATDGKHVIAMPDSVLHVQQRRLVINPEHSSEAPRICPRRVIKYGLYGFHADDSIMKHLVDQIEDGRLPAATVQGHDDGY